jgi:hypothetical protein
VRDRRSPFGTPRTAREPEQPTGRDQKTYTSDQVCREGMPPAARAGSPVQVEPSAARTRDLPPGLFPRRVGNYSLRDCIGQGPALTFFRAVDTGPATISAEPGRSGGGAISPGREVLVALPHSHLADRPGLRERFESEALGLIELGPAAAWRVLDVSPADARRLYVVFEPVDATPCTEWFQAATEALRAGALTQSEYALAGVPELAGEPFGGDVGRSTTTSEMPVDLLVALVSTAARALAPWHEAGAAHGMLLPEDIWLRPPHDRLDRALDKALGGDQGAGGASEVIPPDAVLRLAGFSIADLRDHPGRFGFVDQRADPKRWLSPEQRQAQAFDLTADVFALGLLLYRFASVGPCGATTPTPPLPAPLFRGQRSSVPDFPPLSSLNPAVDPILDRIVAKALSHEPRMRFANAANLASALDRWLARSGLPAGPTLLGLAVTDFAQALSRCDQARFFREGLSETGEGWAELSARGSTDPSRRAVGASASQPGVPGASVEGARNTTMAAAPVPTQARPLARATSNPGAARSSSPGVLARNPAHPGIEPHASEPEFTDAKETPRGPQVLSPALLIGVFVGMLLALILTALAVQFIGFGSVSGTRERAPASTPQTP